MSQTAPVRLPDGSFVEITSPFGVDTFLQTELSRSFLSSDLEVIRRIQAKKQNKRKHEDDVLIHNLTYKMHMIPRLSDPRIFRQRVPESEINVWLDYMAELLEGLSTNSTYVRTGDAGNDGNKFLSICTVMFNHPVPVDLAFQSNFFEALGSIVSACDHDVFPGKFVCLMITMIVSRAFHTATQLFDNKWSAEKAFKKLENSGMLAEFIRCATVPQDKDDETVLAMFEQLQHCSSFLDSKFRRGKPCGDLVVAILSFEDGSTEPRPIILEYLRNISKFIDTIDGMKSANSDLKMCRKCALPEHELGKPLLMCGRCRNTFYCSKECQRADWKGHKVTCRPYTKTESKAVGTVEKLLGGFVQEHYFTLALKVAAQCFSTGLKSSDMIIELNFVENDNGLIPALQSPPVFRVVPKRDYSDGSVEPEWFHCKGGNRWTDQRPEFRSKMEIESARVTPNHFLFLVHHSKMMSIDRFQLIDPETNKSATSDEVMSAFQSALIEDNFEPLSRAFSETKFKEYKRLLETKNSFLRG